MASSLLHDLLIVTALVCVAWAAVPYNSKMKTFSHAIKDGILQQATETVVFEHASGPGTVTEQWFAGCVHEDAVMRIYVDGETSPSLDFNVYLAHGIGVNHKMEASEEIWGFNRMSHTANGGGLQNTYRIPFGSSIKITLQQPHAKCMFWYIVRGMENLPVILGDLILPTNARLRLYKNEGRIIGPSEYYTLATVNGKSGALFQSTLKANSSDFTYLEGCYRVQIDGGEVQLLSSGTEDFFLSAYYFNLGTFHLPNSGLSFKENPGFVTAYKFFENDPVVFSKSMVLMSRCGEDNYHCLKNSTSRYLRGEPGSCHPGPGGRKHCYPGREPLKNVQYHPTNFTTYTWVYEWD